MSETLKEISKKMLLAQLDRDDMIIIDVRPEYAHTRETLPRAVHEDPRKTHEWADGYDRRCKIVLYCASPGEQVSHDVAQALLQKGFTQVHILRGGWWNWKYAGYPTRPKSALTRPKGVVPEVLRP